jgi:hypothetical protein
MRPQEPSLALGFFICSHRCSIFFASIDEKGAIMRAISSTTNISDAYRAGLALGEPLAPFAPEVAFLFSSVPYSIPELLEGLHDAMASSDVNVVGNSGDDFYETTGPADHGAAVLGLSSDGLVRWRLECIDGVQENIQDKMRHLMARLTSGGETPCLGYLVSDFSADASEIETVLGDMVNFPVVGGFAADEHQMEKSYICANHEVISDALIVLAAYGSNSKALARVLSFAK